MPDVTGRLAEDGTRRPGPWSNRNAWYQVIVDNGRGGVDTTALQGIEPIGATPAPPADTPTDATGVVPDSSSM
jgi:hypothetical protein